LLGCAWRTVRVGWKHERTAAALEHQRGPVQLDWFISSSNYAPPKWIFKPAL